MKFSTFVLSAALMTGAALIASRPAQAQLPVRAKIGAYLPKSDETAGNLTFIGEADLMVPNLGQGRYIVSAGYTSGSDGDRSLRLIPITIGRYFSPPNPLGSITGNVYVGAGLGPYFVRVRDNGDSESKTTLGGYGVVGYQFPNPYFVEAKYHLVGKVNGVQPGGLAIMLGRRF